MLLDAARHLDRLEVEADAFATLLSDSDLGAGVPTCPGWTLHDLAVHVGGVHQWAVHAIEQGDPDAVLTEPEPGEELASWYDGCAARLIDLLRRTDPATPAWTFGPRPRTAEFWFRRQAHEIAVHRWDAAGSRGETTVMDADFALDGIDEVLTMILPRQVRLGRTPPLTRSLALDATEGPRLVVGGDGTGEPTGPPDAVVSGPAEALLLLLWRRTTLADPRLVLSGDAAAAEEVLSGALVP